MTKNKAETAVPPEVKAPDVPPANWDEIERIAKMPEEPGPCVHNTLVGICRALVEMTSR